MNQECRSLINYNFASNKYVKSLVSSYFFHCMKNSKLQPSVCCCFAKPLMCYSVLATIHVLVPNVSFLHPSKQNNANQNKTKQYRHNSDKRHCVYQKARMCRRTCAVQKGHIESGWHFRCILWLGFKYAWWWKDVAGGFSPLQYQSMLKYYIPLRY